MKLSLAKITKILSTVAVPITLVTAQSDLSKFQTDEANTGIPVNSTPIAASDGMTTCDVQLALQSGGE
jgi:hypothetical protein